MVVKMKKVLESHYDRSIKLLGIHLNVGDRGGTALELAIGIQLWSSHRLNSAWGQESDAVDGPKVRI